MSKKPGRSNVFSRGQTTNSMTEAEEEAQKKADYVSNLKPGEATAVRRAAGIIDAKEQLVNVLIEEAKLEGDEKRKKLICQQLQNLKMDKRKAYKEAGCANLVSKSVTQDFLTRQSFGGRKSRRTKRSRTKTKRSRTKAKRRTSKRV